jgi:hypothetical protein
MELVAMLVVVAVQVVVLRWFLVDTSRTVRVGRTHQPRAAVPTVLGLERAAMAARAAMGRRWPLNSGEKDEPPRHEGTKK